jgi:hypothetical protein
MFMPICLNFKKGKKGTALWFIAVDPDDGHETGEAPKLEVRVVECRFRYNSLSDQGRAMRRRRIALALPGSSFYPNGPLI